MDYECNALSSNENVQLQPDFNVQTKSQESSDSATLFWKRPSQDDRGTAGILENQNQEFLLSTTATLFESLTTWSNLQPSARKREVSVQGVQPWKSWEVYRKSWGSFWVVLENYYWVARNTTLLHACSSDSQWEPRNVQVSMPGFKNTPCRVRGRIQYYVSCAVAVLLKAQRRNAGEMMIVSREHNGEKMVSSWTLAPQRCSPGDLR